MTHSPDGDWFWTGSAWVPARSPDRAWWWDGNRWVPSGIAVGAVRYQYQPTAWTRRLQLIIVALLVLGLVVAVLVLPSAMTQIFQQSINRSVAQQPTNDPAAGAQVRQTMTSIMDATVLFAGVFTVIFYGVVLVGIWKLWRWLYWYFVVSGLLASVGLLQNLVDLTGVVPYPFPAWFIVPGVLSGLAWLILALWMIVVYRRYGTWARRLMPVSADTGTNFP